MSEWKTGDGRTITGLPEVRPRRIPDGRRSLYVPNHSSFGQFILSDQVREPTVAVAEEIKLAAIPLAPTRTPGKRRSKHKPVAKSFEVVQRGPVVVVGGNPRISAQVVNTAPDAAVHEFGSKRVPRRRMLGRAGALFGDFKPDKGPG